MKEEIFKNGASFLIRNDNGLYYNKWKQFDDRTGGMSSHPQLANPYRVDGTVLIGIYENSTCIQFEAHEPFSVLHVLDYIQYKLTGKNIGVIGRSDHTIHKPLVVNSLLFQNW